MSASPAIARRLADINRRMEAVKAVIAYSKASSELLAMAVEECERLRTDSLAVAADCEHIVAEWIVVQPA